MLLTLLDLKIGSVRLNPALPTFLSPGIIGMLISVFRVTNVNDIRSSLGGFKLWVGVMKYCVALSLCPFVALFVTSSIPRGNPYSYDFVIRVTTTGRPTSQ